MIKRIYIEITNRCNLRCSFCDFHHREYKEMSLEEFDKVLKQVKPITSFIYLHVQGEPFLHSQFDKILDLCDLYDMKVQLVTNGFLLKDHLTIQHKCIRKVSISIHSIDEQSTDENEYMDTIFKFITNNKYNFYIDLRFWLKDSMKPKAEYCLNRILETYSVELSDKVSYTLEKNVFLNFASKFEWPNSAKSEFNDGTCLGAKTMLAILSSGQVTICCLDSEGRINLGNVFNDSLETILVSNHYQSIIQGFNNNKCIEQLCQKCSYKNRFR